MTAIHFGPLFTEFLKGLFLKILSQLFLIACHIKRVTKNRLSGRALNS